MYFIEHREFLDQLSDCWLVNVIGTVCKLAELLRKLPACYVTRSFITHFFTTCVRVRILGMPSALDLSAHTLCYFLSDQLIPL
jgi:hypothetical protein